MTMRPYFKKSTQSAQASGDAGPWSVPDLCAAYQWPTGLAGGGRIAIVELGGGFTQADMLAYFRSINQPTPMIDNVSVDGTHNSPGGDADGEVALDIQVAAASYSVATGRPASIRVYWSRDIATAVRLAARDGCDVCSISWGADEADWGEQRAQAMEDAALAAGAAGMMVFAAAGDNDSSDGGAAPANVDLPASAPHVIGCGGTMKTRSSESVWNEAPGNPRGDGTGGGYSTVFPMPTWQDGKTPRGPGRMVPDVSACADPDTGYRVYYHGAPQIVGGTSAVAPLYAGLFAALGRRIGFIGARLWNSQACFADIAQGDNGMYHARTGPDPCTGLGVPIGRKLEAAFSMHPRPVPDLGSPMPGSPVPDPGSRVTLAQAAAWAESQLPDVFMSRETVARLIGIGLKKNWPTGEG